MWAQLACAACRWDWLAPCAAGACVLQGVAGCCRVLQGVAAWDIPQMLVHLACAVCWRDWLASCAAGVCVCCGVLQSVAVCCRVLQCVAGWDIHEVRSGLARAVRRFLCCRVLQGVAGYCRVLQCDGRLARILCCRCVCCDVLQYVVAVCCRVLQCDQEIVSHLASRESSNGSSSVFLNKFLPHNLVTYPLSFLLTNPRD